MKHYELLYLISAQLPENQLEPIQSEISEWITSSGGTVTKAVNWGRRKLAYPVNKERFGFYVLMEFDCAPEQIRELEKKLKLHKLVLRSILSIKKPLSAKELLAQEHAQKRNQARAAEAALRPSRQEAQTSEVKASKPETKIRLDELDKKLDELLDQDILN